MKIEDSILTNLKNNQSCLANLDKKSDQIKKIKMVDKKRIINGLINLFIGMGLSL